MCESAVVDAGLHAYFLLWSRKYWTTSAVSTTDGWLKLNLASCVVRKTRSSGALVLRSMTCVIWCLWTAFIYDMVVDTQFHKFHARPFARVLYVFLIKNIGRWLSWVPPGSTGQLYKDDVVHIHSAHRYYITRIEGGVRSGWYCYIFNRRLQKNWSKHAIHKKRESDVITFYMKDNLSDDGTSKIDLRMIM